MSSYEKVLKSVKEYKTLSAHITALGKIRAATEDENLKKAIEAVVGRLQGEHSRSKSKSTPLALDKTKVAEINSLIKGCAKVVGTKKPEWQVLAEKNGWAPKT